MLQPSGGFQQSLPDHAFCFFQSWNNANTSHHSDSRRSVGRAFVMIAASSAPEPRATLTPGHEARQVGHVAVQSGQPLDRLTPPTSRRKRRRTYRHASRYRLQKCMCFCSFDLQELISHVVPHGGFTVWQNLHSWSLLDVDRQGFSRTGRATMSRRARRHRAGGCREDHVPLGDVKSSTVRSTMRSSRQHGLLSLRAARNAHAAAVKRRRPSSIEQR